MKVFISWSGPLSHKVALALKDWLPSVLQVVEPYVSSEDIDKGARWSSDISKELEASSFGIICVTPDNLDAAWVNFEAGALSKSIERSRVAPFLFGVDRTAVQGPLLQFQSTLVEHDDVRKLIVSLNKACNGSGLDETRLDEVFEVWWPHLQGRLQGLATEAPPTPGPKRKTEDVLAEVLELVRSQQKLLSNPEELLPAGYLRFALDEFRGVERGFTLDHPAVADLLHRWERVHVMLTAHRDDLPNEIVEAIEGLDDPIRYLAARRRRVVRRRAIVEESDA
ncbi:MAG TPA: TIR domain-containing protein [Conexibacter sp.]|nr:TIR domain-containing protein [Conexibacter sp.]